jgi:hypothetical protein
VTAGVARRSGIVLVLWLTFAFVTWSVVFDRQVQIAGYAFTREQILRHQQGQPLLTLDDAFTPRVRAGAVWAWICTVPVLLGGAVAVRLTYQRRPVDR